MIEMKLAEQKGTSYYKTGINMPIRRLKGVSHCSAEEHIFMKYKLQQEGEIL
jgi:hypothetical protein